MKAKGYPGEPIERRPDADNGFFIRGQVSDAQAVHTATDIPVSAYSNGSRSWVQFIGLQDNTDIFFKLARAAFGGY
ncbi:MAG: hypothetical protein C4321_05570 [Chloroflexota bacterium]